MKYKTLLVVTLCGLLLLAGCGEKKAAPQVPSGKTEAGSSQSEGQNQAASSSQQEEEKDFVLIVTDEEPFSERVLPEDATDVEEGEGSVSYTSPLTFNATVEFYKDLIAEDYIDGQEEEVDTEALGIEAGWKFDGMREERLFSVTVAMNDSGTVGVAVIY